jgi:hypothetical protein
MYLLCSILSLLCLVSLLLYLIGRYGYDKCELKINIMLMNQESLLYMTKLTPFFNEEFFLIRERGAIFNASLTNREHTTLYVVTLTC